jgi:YNFM family putative membrane transporter
LNSSRRTFAVVLAGFSAFIPLYATQPLLPLLTQVFHVSAIRASLTVTLAILGVALAAPLAGSISDRYGRKRSIVISAFALAVFTFAAAFSSNLDTLIAWRFLQGIFTPGIISVTVAYIHEEWDPGELGRTTAAYITGTVLGGFSGRFISGLAANRFGWQSAFLALAVVSLLCAALLWRWLPVERHRRSDSENKGWSAVRDHLRNRRLLATYAVGFCVLFSMTAAFTYVNFYLAAPPFLLQPAALGSLFFVYLIGAAVTPTAGRWIDRYGNRRAVAVAFAGGIGGVLLTLIPRLPAVIAGLALCCTGVFIAQSAASSFLGKAASRNRALAVGLYGTCYYSGGSAGASLPGFLWHAGGWPACVAMIVAVQALTIGLALGLWSDT